MAPDLDTVRAEIFDRLTRAVKDRRSAMHTPVVATRGVDGQIKARIVVLRDFDRAKISLRFHTDWRGHKIAELTADPQMAFAFYDPHHRVQIRVEGRASLHHDDHIAEQAWATSQRMSRICYGVAPAPGTIMDGADDFALPEHDDEIAAGRANFSAVICHIEHLEYLFLRHEGHRRARFSRQGGDWHGVWLTP